MTIKEIITSFEDKSKKQIIKELIKIKKEQVENDKEGN